MNVCGKKHEEIVYLGRGCPLCMAVDEIECLQIEVNDLKEELSRPKP